MAKKNLYKKLAFMFLGLFSLVSCNSNSKTSGDGASKMKNFVDINFEDTTIEFDGFSHTISASNVPSFANVSYINEGPFWHAGEYDITCTIEADGYNKFEKTAKLSIIYPEAVEKDINTVLNGLRDSVYQSNYKIDHEMGVNDISSIGVNKLLLENAVYYPINVSGTVYKTSEIGLTKDGTFNGTRFNNFLNSLKEVEGNKIIDFDLDEIEFDSTISVSGVDNLYIKGNGAKFWLKSWNTYFSFTNCKNLHINDLEFDMVNPPVIGGTIESIDEQSSYCDVTIDVPDEFDLSYFGYTDFMKNSSEVQGSYIEYKLDEFTGKYIPDEDHNLFYNSNTQLSSLGILKVTCNPVTHKAVVRLNRSFQFGRYVTPVIGTRISLAFTMYQYYGFSFKGCDDLYLEHLTTHVSAGMGLRLSEGKNANINHVNFVLDENSSRLMTCTADIFHTVAVAGNLNITNCIMENSHDDALNIKTWYYKVRRVNKSQKEILIEPEQLSDQTVFDVGDTICAFDPITLQTIDTFKVVTSRKDGSNWTITVDKRPKDIDETTLIGNDDKATKLHLNNCLIQNKRNRGILLQARHSEISNCTFANIVHGAMEVLAARDQFGEAIVPNDIVIKNNKFIGNDNNDISIFSYGTGGTNKTVANTIKNIKIQNNFFKNSLSTPVDISGGGDIEFSNNLFSNDRRFFNRFIYLRRSDNLTIQDNRFTFSSVFSPVNFIDVEDNQVTNLTNENNLELH